MKTFKQFTEQYTPKGTFNKIPGKDSGLLDRIKSKEDIELEKSEFKRVTGIPLAKRKNQGKLDPEVLKQNPDLDPTKPRDYMKLKRMQNKLGPKIDLAMKTEEAIVNSVGGGQIAGTVEAGDDPPVKKKKRYIYGGTGSRKMWMNNK